MFYQACRTACSLHRPRALWRRRLASCGPPLEGRGRGLCRACRLATARVGKITASAASPADVFRQLPAPEVFLPRQARRRRAGLEVARSRTADRPTFPRNGYSLGPVRRCHPAYAAASPRSSVPPPRNGSTWPAPPSSRKRWGRIEHLILGYKSLSLSFRGSRSENPEPRGSGAALRHPWIPALRNACRVAAAGMTEHFPSRGRRAVLLDRA